ncbi:hypothetical protein TorRG33x02_232600 [Trema orientale]|uniref:Uncharacterized protein n=1 Tax=Trema orientale TaxID=63057 RepID=A0A2P5E5V6_TREOI|nr:hypothetical protein TorRG33x02_232600 [Trema orientale]
MAGLDGLNRQSRNQSECAVWPVYQSVRFEFVDSNRPNRTYIFAAGLGGFRVFKPQKPPKPAVKM